MIEGVDYSSDPSETIDGSRTVIILDLLTTEPHLFFRENFTTP